MAYTRWHMEGHICRYMFRPLHPYPFHTGLCTWGTSDWTGYLSSSATRLCIHTLATTLYQDKLPDMFSSLEKPYHPYTRCDTGHTTKMPVPRTPFPCIPYPGTTSGVFSQGGKGLVPSSFPSGWGHGNRAEETGTLRLDTFKAG